MNIECSKQRFEEIVLPSTDSHLLLQKINAQIIEFNPQGTLAAIGCKYGIVLIFDILAKEVVRYFNYYLDKDQNQMVNKSSLIDDEEQSFMLELNKSVDEFHPYRMVNFAYVEDDFVYQQKPKKNEIDGKNSANLKSQGDKFQAGDVEMQASQTKNAQEEINEAMNLQNASDVNQVNIDSIIFQNNSNESIKIKIEPKDKLNQSRAQISNIDWSLDGRLICVTIKNENVAVIWNINTCKKVFQYNATSSYSNDSILKFQEESQEIQDTFGNINRAHFMCVNSDYLLVSGDKAEIVSIKELEKKVSVVLQSSEEDISLIEGRRNSNAENIKNNSSGNLQNIGSSSGLKNSSSMKKKINQLSQANYILKSIFNNDKRYFILVDNIKKLIFILQDKIDNEVQQKKQKADKHTSNYLAKQFFNILNFDELEVKRLNLDQDEIQGQQGAIIQQNLSQLDFISAQTAEQVQQAINQINFQLFDILAIQKFKNQKSFIQHINFNEDGTYMLCTYSDRALILYQLDFQKYYEEQIQFQVPQPGKKNTASVKDKKDKHSQQFAKIIYMKNEMKDVINGRKWQNSAFVKLNQNTMIMDELNQFDYEKMQSRSVSEKNSITSVELYYNGVPLVLGKNLNIQNSFTAKRNELFVSSLGETGSNELKFFCLSSERRVNQCLQRVELTIDGCNHLTVHSKFHFSVLMASNNGSIFLCTAKPCKIIQNLAPGFHEIERNIWYVEKEETSKDSLLIDKERDYFEKLENLNQNDGLLKLDERQRKLAYVYQETQDFGEKEAQYIEIDIENKSENCFSILNNLQRAAIEKPHLCSLDNLFKNQIFKNVQSNLIQQKQMPNMFVYSHVNVNDSYAEMARNNLQILKEKFNKNYMELSNKY